MKTTRQQADEQRRGRNLPLSAVALEVIEGGLAATGDPIATARFISRLAAARGLAEGALVVLRAGWPEVIGALQAAVVARALIEHFSLDGSRLVVAPSAAELAEEAMEATRRLIQEAVARGALWP